MSAMERCFQTVASALCVLDGAGHIVASNAAAAALLGRTEEDLRGLRYASLLAPEDQGLAAPTDPGGLADMPLYCRRPHRISSAEGPARWVIWEATVDGEGADRLIHGRLSRPGDAELALRQAESLSQHTGVGAWEIDFFDGVRLRWDRTCAAIHGVGIDADPPSFDEMLAHYAEPCRSKLRATLLAMTSDRKSLDQEVAFATARGEPRWVRVTAKPDLCCDSPFRICGTIEDITERRRRNSHLRRLSAVAENTTNAVFIVDRHHRITWVNRAFTELTGYEPVEALGRVPGDLLHSEKTDAAHAARISKAIEAGEPLSLSMQHRARSGRDFWVWSEIRPLTDDRGDHVGMLSVLTDITERRAFEKRLIAAERDARAARRQLLSAIEALPDGFVLYDAEDRLVVCNETFRSIVPEIADACLPGAKLEDILRVGLDRSVFADAIGREDAWLKDRIEAFRRPIAVTEIALSDGRHIRSVDKAMPDGGRVGLRVDITEFRESEDRLRSAERAAKTAHERLLIAIEALPHGFVFFDENDELALWNSKFRDVLGPCKHLAVPGTKFETMVDECIAAGVFPDVMEDREAFRALRLAAPHLMKAPEEQRIFDGRWLRITDVAVPGGGRVGLRLDITEQKAAEARLRAAERRAREATELLTSAIDVLPDGFVLFDRNQRMLICNEQYRSLVPADRDVVKPGVTFRELLWNGIRSGTFPSAVGREEAFVEERIAIFERPYTSIETRLGDGRWIRAVDRATPSGGRVGLRIDITESKAKEERLRTAERAAQSARSQLVSAVEALPDAFAFYDARDRLVLCNERYRQYYARTAPVLQPGIEFEDMLRFGLSKGQYPEAVGREEAWIAERLAAHRQADSDVVQCLDGNRWVRIVEKSTSEGGRVGLRIDITEMKRQQEALEIAREKAEAANRTKSLFLANMSHEIRTPMNGVMGMAEILHSGLSDPEHRAMVGVIRESGETLLTILNDILDFSKIEADRLELEAVAFAPAELARKVESLHSLKAAEKGIAFRVTTEGDVARPLVGDPHRLLQVLHNLVSNAIKFTKSGTVSVLLDCRMPGPLRVTVRDTGIGMSDAQLARLFDPFVQADNSTTRRFGGTGLGMAIVKRLVEAMDGSIDVASARNRGTRIDVAVPLRPAGSDHEGMLPLVSEPILVGPDADAGEERVAEREDAPPTAAVTSELRVLAADDNRTNRTVLAALLRRAGAVAKIVESGADALAVIGAEPVDLLLLDISMPGMDGIETLAAIRRREEELGLSPAPALAVTANALRHQVDSYLANGFDGHIAKPVRTETLKESLSAYAQRLGRTVGSEGGAERASKV